MATRSTRMSTRMRIWIPPQYSTIYKFTVTRDDGTIDDLTDLAHEIEIEDGVTDLIGRFRFKLWDPSNTYKDVWNGMEVVKWYTDYDSTASTLRFQGRIEKISYQDNQVVVTGRSESLTFLNITVTKSYDNVDCSDILKSLVTTYSTGFTVSNVTQSNVLTTKNWHQKPFWDCVKELAKEANFDVYVDANKDWHFFKVGSVENETEGIMYNYNLMEVKEFADDIQQIRNRVIVYGAKQDGIQLITTAEDKDSQDAYGIREEVIQDENITDATQADEIAAAKLARLKDPPKVGEVKGILLARIQPGEKIMVGSPGNNLNQGLYSIQSYKHNVDVNRGLYTTIKVEKEPRMISHVFGGIIERENLQKDVSINPFEMRYTYNFLFNTDSGSHTLTEITDGVLKLQTGQSSGDWTSAAKDTGTNVEEVYVLAIGQSLTGAVFEVSANDGSNYTTVANKTNTTIPVSGQSSKLRVKVTLSDTNAQVDSLSIMYNKI